MALNDALVEKVLAGVLASAQALRELEGGWSSSAAAWWRGGSSEEANDQAHRIEGWLAACGPRELNAVLLRLAGRAAAGNAAAETSAPQSQGDRAADGEEDEATDELTRTIKSVCAVCLQCGFLSIRVRASALPRGPLPTTTG